MLLHKILHKQEALMSQVDDLKAAVANLKDGAAKASADIMQSLADLQAEVAKGPGPLPDISEQISDITTIAQNLANLDTTAKADDPGAPSAA